KTDNLLARKYPQYEGLTFRVSQRQTRLSKFEILGDEKESIFEYYFYQFMSTGLLQLREYNSLLGPSGKNYLEAFNSYYQASSLEFKLNTTQRKASLRPHVKFESLFAETISDYFAQISNEVYISGNSIVLHRHAELSFDSKFLDVYYVFPQSAVELAMAKKNGEAVLGEVIFFEKGLDSDRKYRFLGRGQIRAELFSPHPS
ncbi:MAG: hypothetical protein VX642_02310, partial [Bdellovibrionota bacterium]|nr:hypothetical protein [Bdellovibrionota bacterium]